MEKSNGIEKFYTWSLYNYSRPEILECLREMCSPYKKEEVPADPNRTYVSLHYIVSGKGRLYYRGQSYELVKGDLFIIPPKEAIRYKADKEDPFCYYWVVLAGQSAYEMLEEIGLSRERVYGRCKGHHTEIVDLFGRMNRAYLERPRASYEILGWFYLLFDRLKAGFQTENDFNKGHYVNQTVILVGCSYMNPHFTVEDICVNLNLSLSYLNRVFKRDMGMSPKQYLTFIRIKNACDLLVQTNRRVADIARLSGFEDTKLFARNFKKSTGMTASAFRDTYARTDPREAFAAEKAQNKYINAGGK